MKLRKFWTVGGALGALPLDPPLKLGGDLLKITPDMDVYTHSRTHAHLPI